MNSSVESVSLVEVGKVGRPHGLNGAFYVSHAAGGESALSYLQKLWIGPSRELIFPYHVTEASFLPKGWLLRLEELHSIEGAQQLVGKTLFAEREWLQATEEGEFYFADLQKCQLIDSATGQAVGHLRGIEPRETFGGSHDRWWARIGNTDVVIPATKTFIGEVSLLQKRITVHNLNSLME